MQLSFYHRAYKHSRPVAMLRQYVFYARFMIVVVRTCVVQMTVIPGLDK